MVRNPLCWVAAGLVLAVYLAVLGVMPKGFFWSPDEGAKYIQLRSIRWDGGLLYEIPYAGAVNDPGFDFYPTRCRHEDLYPVRTDEDVRLHWPIWFSLLTLPFSSLFGAAGVYVVPLLGGFATALLAGFLVRDAGALWVAATILLAGLGTPVFFYSLTFWEHTLATALGMGALGLAATMKAPRTWKWLLIVLLLLGATLLRVEMMAFAAALVGGWFLSMRFSVDSRTARTPPANRRRDLLGLALLLLLLAAALGASLTWRHRWLFKVLPENLLANLQKLPSLPSVLRDVLINSPAEQGPIVAAHWEFLALGAFAAAAVAPFLRSTRLQAVLLVPALAISLEFSLLLALRPEPYISLHGVLPAAPFVVFALHALPGIWRERRHFQLVIAATALLYLVLGFGIVFTFLVEPDGHYKTGLEWGARYLLTLYPISAALCMVALGEVQRSDRPLLLKRAVAFLVIAMMLVGVQFQVRGVRMLLESRRLVETWQAALPLDRPVVTNIWWLPAAMAPFFTEHPMLCVRSPENLSAWFPAATAAGIEGFTFASLAPTEPALFRSPDVEVTGNEERVVSGLHLRTMRFGRLGSGDAEPRAASAPGENREPAGVSDLRRPIP